jgi:ATP:cob(I)alamin adenosyltransferase
MKAEIYTRGGDTGQTSLLGGARVDKDDPRVEVYGTLDEATSALGLARATSRYDDICTLIIELQGQFIPIMSEIASLPGTQLKKGPLPHLQAEQVQDLERAIDHYNAEWIQSKQFTRPGGSQASAAMDLARSICRRAERRLISLGRTEEINPELLKYLNRLSDLLYVLARIDEQRTIVDAIFSQLNLSSIDFTVDQNQTLVRKEAKTMPPSLNDCERMMQAGIKKAQAIGTPMVLSIVDPNGDVLDTRRMDDALLISVTLAPHKAYTAAAARMPTADLARASQPGQSLYGIDASLPKVTLVGGGIPLCRDGKVVGAVGVSGGPVEQDIAVAQAMVEAFLERTGVER